MPSSRIPRRCNPIAFSIRRRVMSMLFPVATHPGRSGTEAPQSLVGSLLIRTRYCNLFIASLLLVQVVAVVTLRCPSACPHLDARLPVRGQGLADACTLGGFL